MRVPEFWGGADGPAGARVGVRAGLRPRSASSNLQAGRAAAVPSRGPGAPVGTKYPALTGQSPLSPEVPDPGCHESLAGLELFGYRLIRNFHNPKRQPPFQAPTAFSVLQLPFGMPKIVSTFLGWARVLLALSKSLQKL